MNTIMENRGTGAGGSNTNKNGKSYEDKVDIEQKLIDIEFFLKIQNKNINYSSKKLYNKVVYYFKQANLKKYLQLNGITIYRNPDIAYLKEYNDGKKHLTIFEIKNQNGSGSVDTKLWAGIGLKEEYEICLGKDYTIDYNFILSDYFKNQFDISPKFKILKKILLKHNINILYGSDEDYEETMIKLIIN